MLTAQRQSRVYSV